VKIPEPVRTPPPPPPRGALRYAVPERAKWSPTVGRSAAQRNYHAALFSGLASYVITVGPAGTGKTHLAVQAGAAALLSGAAQRLIITRPAVTVDEDLGYLPGSIDKKMEPYMVPILDLLADVWSSDELEELQDERKLQIVPLGFMRGRTFSDAFIVADEMQNCSKSQMRTLLTRLGQNSRMVVTGDLNQADASNNSNGLRYLVTKLRAQLHGEAVAADASDEGAIAELDAGGESEQLPLRDAVHRDFELVTLDNSSMQRNAAVQTVLRLLV
jgi:phosphate starvation-inducible PhoH-like protein